ncbi:hypothetical protein Cme02nite_28300 [Catellatospora methionotrophica]|uniref:Uncharacterized protein n=1 Tax=Catellatospora methionotrophica TaxID=121620 RepID=A0A8J3L4Y6_9ACTN|nr:hypothetical protein Cme02nite_28300 [Catellatospora methionotrophica]
MRRCANVVTSAADSIGPLGEMWVGVAVTHQGLTTLGVPQQALDAGHPECPSATPYFGVSRRSPLPAGPSGAIASAMRSRQFAETAAECRV